MKFSEIWLRELTGITQTREELVAQLTMAGLEVESVTPVAGDFSGVFVGEVMSCRKHPEADRLTLCKVRISDAEPLDIVCGASNVRAGLKVAVATIDGHVGELKIKPAKLRGEASFGMLCSVKELGLAEVSEGIVELPADAPVGVDLRTYWQLDDASIEVDLTPNRGDCLSVHGLAREVAALTAEKYQPLPHSQIAVSTTATLPVTVTATASCPHYAGRVLRNVNAEAKTPMWLQERLRRSGVRSIDAIVDVTNYVMLELGQPMHAFDLSRIRDGITVRMATSGEQLTLLGGQQITMTDDCLVIADAAQPLALAGVMGGSDSAVSAATKNIFLESAFFAPSAVAGRARKFGLVTESAHRFERGVDPALQVIALDRATELLLAIVGGETGPIVNVKTAAYPEPKTIVLPVAKIAKMIGIEISEQESIGILQRLGMTVQRDATTWRVSVPSHRFDITIAEDLIEEIIRVYGYHRLPTVAPVAPLLMQPKAEAELDNYRISELLQSHGYSEAINYSFVAPAWQVAIAPNAKTMTLVNPLSQELSQMRVSLWPGLLRSLQYNQNRQQSDVRLFEFGLNFQASTNGVLQLPYVAGVAAGQRTAKQWGLCDQPIDFFDIKASIASIIKLTGSPSEFTFEVAEHEALHPGQSAKVMRNGELCGWVGALHPQVVQDLSLHGPVYVFELALNVLRDGRLSRFKPLSKFPAIRRDLALVVSAEVPAQAVVAKIATLGGELVNDVAIFDVYQGGNIAPGKKSMALALTLQHQERTLVDEDVNKVIDQIVLGLNRELGIILRE